jgi:catechol-2,3-dioxygenase
MIELIFVACLRTDALQCDERSRLYTAEIGLMGCMVTAQAELADWSQAHPHLRVVHWSCRWADTARLGA